MSDAEYLASRQPPTPPSTQAQEDIWGNDEGDKSWQIDEAEQYHFSEAGQAEYASWLEQDDGTGTGTLNSAWYNPDGSRTSYAGPYAPALS